MGSSTERVSLNLEPRSVVTGRRIAVLGGILITILTAIVTFTVNQPIFRYPALAVGAGAISYFLWEVSPDKTGQEWGRKKRKAADTVSFLLLTLIVVTVFLPSVDPIPDIVYVFLLSAVILTVVRSLRTDVWIGVPLLMALLSSLLVRGIHYYSAAVVGQDAKRHLGSASYMAVTGNPIPNEITYYSDYPLAHTLSAMTELLLSIPTRQAWMVSVVLGHVLLLLGVYYLAWRITELKGVAVVAVIIAGHSSGTLIYGYQAHAQAIGEALLLTIILTLATPSRNKRGIVLLCGLLVIVAQNMIPLVIAGAAALAIVSSILAPQIGRLWKRRARETPPLAMGPLLFIGTISFLSAVVYWIETSYINYQVVRILGIILPSSELSSAASTGLPPTVAIFGFSPPGILVRAAPILVIAAGLVSFDLILFSRLDRVEDNRSLLWATIFSGLFFAIWTVSLFSGGNAGVSRAASVVAVFTAPILALGVDWLDQKRFVGTGLAILLIVSVVAAGVIGTSYVERPEEEFSPTAGEDEMAAVAWAEEYSSETVHTDGYLESAAFWDQVSQGAGPSNINGTTSYREPDSFDRTVEIAAEHDQLVLHRQRWQAQVGFAPSPTDDVYDSGRGTIFRPRNLSIEK